MPQGSGWMQMSLATASVILSERAKRRRFISGLLAVIVGIFCLGNWPLKSWVDASLWRILIWWGGCAFLCLLLVLFAVFDALAVIAEEKRKIGLRHPLDDEDSSRE